MGLEKWPFALVTLDEWHTHGHLAPSHLAAKVHAESTVRHVALSGERGEHRRLGSIIEPALLRRPERCFDVLRPTCLFLFLENLHIHLSCIEHLPLVAVVLLDPFNVLVSPRSANFPS